MQDASDFATNPKPYRGDLRPYDMVKLRPGDGKPLKPPAQHLRLVLWLKVVEVIGEELIGVAFDEQHSKHHRLRPGGHNTARFTRAHVFTVIRPGGKKSAARLLIDDLNSAKVTWMAPLAPGQEQWTARGPRLTREHKRRRA